MSGATARTRGAALVAPRAVAGGQRPGRRTARHGRAADVATRPQLSDWRPTLSPAGSLADLPLHGHPRPPMALSLERVFAAAQRSAREPARRRPALQRRPAALRRGEGLEGRPSSAAVGVDVDVDVDVDVGLDVGLDVGVGPAAACCRSLIEPRRFARSGNRFPQNGAKQVCADGGEGALLAGGLDLATDPASRRGAWSKSRQESYGVQ